MNIVRQKMLYLPSLLVLSVCTFADEDAQVSAYTQEIYPTRVYWGDTHLHTNLSVDVMDIYDPMGNGLSRDDAYRFARGQEVIGHNGMAIRRGRPLDFLVIADHAENLGLHQAIINNNPTLMESEEGQRLRADYIAANGDPKQLAALFREIYKNHGLYGTFAGGDPFRRTVWDTVAKNADDNNVPGVFTAFIGYEFTSHDFNLHRVVLFKDDASRALQLLPFSQFDSKNPEDLWAHLERYESDTGGQVIAIPHNANLSRGRMFMLEDSSGNEFDLNYARARSRWEPLYEATQNKGDSETHPLLSPDDEFAEFETWRSYYALEDNEDAWRKYEYARSALKLGLQQQQRLGINPFKYGLIGSTDSHSSMSSIEEYRYVGNGPKGEPIAGRMTMVMYDRGSIVPGWKLNAGGYAAIWSTENTRASLFEAMKRREVYASTGPRITLRFFGGWDFALSDVEGPRVSAIGYKKGVPMGSDLADMPDGATPKFLIRAVKDPEGANLDRVQVIKGWLGADGSLNEKVYNVALSDNRIVNNEGKAPHVGSTVNVKDATYVNSIGDPELAIVWEDPEFNPSELAFYYVRVLEIPTPRWPAYDAKVFGLNIDEIPSEILMTTQERAYSSPIWFSPTH